MSCIAWNRTCPTQSFVSCRLKNNVLHEEDSQFVVRSTRNETLCRTPAIPMLYIILFHCSLGNILRILSVYNYAHCCVHVMSFPYCDDIESTYKVKFFCSSLCVPVFN